MRPDRRELSSEPGVRMGRRRGSAIVALAAALWAAPAAAEERLAPVVVELFTSQGCSSCPPADEFLTELAQSGRNVLPLAFHVTYWDRLGWRDPFSLEAATARQRDYARTLGDGGVYTPELVVGGRQGLVGSDREQALAAIAQASARTAAPVALGVRRTGDTLVAAVGAGRGRSAVLLVGYDPEHRTAIGRGENGGRTLRESNIVRSLTPLGTWDGTPVQLTSPKPAGERFAVLLQSDDGTILAAAAAAP